MEDKIAATGSDHGTRPLSVVPHALAEWNDLAVRLRDRRPVVLLDFDGTLAPIVADPGAARLPDAARRVLERLAEVCPLAVVSGRGLADVRQKVGSPGLWYAGSHGFELVGPHGEVHEHEAARAALPSLSAAEGDLREALAVVPGLTLEPKRFALAVHYRNVEPHRAAEVVDTVRRVGARFDRLRVTGGRLVTELRPDIDWDKGRALGWLLHRMGLAGDPTVLLLYAGDDLTDEDALRVVRDDGLGVVVRSAEHGDRSTSAHYAVDDPEQLRLLLERIAAMLGAPKVG
jgi:trehalose-phosphatase